LAIGSTPPRRATQSLIGTIHYCLRHPSLLGCELLWRWAFGIPALWLIVHQAQQIFALVPVVTLNNLDAAAYDPVQAATILAGLVPLLISQVLQVLAWLVPVLFVGWTLISGVGRWFVLRQVSRLRPDLVAHPPPLRNAIPIAGFQATRIVGLTAAFAVAFVCIRGAGSSAFVDPQHPNLVFFLSIVILATLGAFSAWAAVGWTVTMGPLLLVRERRGFFRSAMHSLRLGRRLQSKLIEINLVLGIVKLAALVLDMVFSAIPMPFESATTPAELHIWWACVAVGYFVVNDFCQVVRLVGMVELLEQFRPSALPPAQIHQPPQSGAIR
jgi:hypothetical protein